MILELKDTKLSIHQIAVALQGFAELAAECKDVENFRDELFVLCHKLRQPGDVRLGESATTADMEVLYELGKAGANTSKKDGDNKS